MLRKTQLPLDLTVNLLKAAGEHTRLAAACAVVAQ